MQNIATAALKVGDIVEHTGGYNCTKTQFYIIDSISKSGKKVGIRELGQVQISGDWMNGNVGPNLEHIGSEIHEVAVKTANDNGEPMLRGRINHTVRDQENGEVKWVNTGSLENFYKWNGKPKWNNCD